MISTRKNALLSVTNKQNIDTLAKELIGVGYSIFSSGGTYTYLKDRNIAVTEVSDYTQFPEIMSGRVKTLHPKIHGGLLAKRDNEDHMKQAKEHKILMLSLIHISEPTRPY